MPTYQYSAKDQNARTITGKIVAGDEATVLDELRKRRLVILEIKEQRSSLSSTGERAKAIKVEEVILFTRQMATMIDAGIPILQTMEALQEQAANPSFKKVLGAIKEDIRLGSGLSAAFAKHPRVFDNLFVNMLRVGETGGVLTMILERLAGYTEKSAKLKRKVTMAMVYPAVIVSMAFIVTTILLVKVVPTFKTIYGSFGRELPPMTAILLNFSDACQQNFLFFIAGMGALVGLFVLAKRNEKGAYEIDRWKLAVPIFGDLICKVSVSRFCRTLSVLVQSGVPILESLDIVRRTIGNLVLESIIKDVIESVRGGESIAEPLSRSRIFPTMVTRMIAVGEQSGQLDKMLSKVGEFYDDQVDSAVEGLTSMIEPLIIGFLGIVVGFIVMALFLPIINITQVLQ
ncbi:MAG: type II secretion system F family protein [Candidatus Omnitrophica bacterium]|nr:type II secretion system F family protein [Candidatus Omnitrophota bacterium]